MLAHRDLHSTLRANRAVFHLADLHVHSLASADIRTGNRFASLSAELQTLLRAVPETAAADPATYEEAVIAAAPPRVFLDALVSRRNTVIGGASAGSDTDWAVVAVTDHNVCRYSTMLASLAYSERSTNRLLVLPGIELDVEYPCPGANESATVHVLCIFRPGTSDSDIRLALVNAGADSWQFGSRAIVPSLPKFIDAVRTHNAYPAICIAAHAASGKGVHRETQKTILSWLEAELSRVAGELQRIADEAMPSQARDKKELEQRLAALQAKRSADGIALEVLRLIGQCGFDALQVGKPGDGVHYRRLHRFREGHGRAVPIVASDAHNPGSVFDAGHGAPFLKLPPLSAATSETAVFEAVRKALRYGETRFNTVSLAPPQYWISGIEIAPDAATAAKFWPTPSGAPVPTSPDSFILPLSRNLNTFIGGRGSGKSAAIEALAFVTEPQRFVNMLPSRDKRPDFYNRAEATLSGCRVRLCWQFAGDGVAAHLPKKAVFAQRYFDVSHRHQPVEYRDADGTLLVPEQVPPHTVQIFRLGEIEQQAGPERLRALFDQICGQGITDHETKIAAMIKSLQAQRGAMLKLAVRIRELTADEAPLRKYVDRLKLLVAVDTPEMKAAYDAIDELESAQAAVGDVQEKWSSALDTADLAGQSAAIQALIDEVASEIVYDDGAVKPHLESLLTLFAPPPGTETASIARGMVTKFDDLNLDGKKVSELLELVASNLNERVAVAKNKLTQQGLPAGSKDREAKKKAFGECEAALARYQAAMREWDDAEVKRASLRCDLLLECAAKSALRKKTAADITAALKRDIDTGILIIEADAQAQRDWSQFKDWMATSFSGQDIKFQEERALALLESGLKPDALRTALLGIEDPDPALLVVDRPSARDGNVDGSVATQLLSKCRGRVRLAPEADEAAVAPEVWAKVPEEVRQGLVWFPGHSGPTCADRALALDEIMFEDVPVIRLNDRPGDAGAVARPVEELSPGQRCSAVLPILLLTGTCPLIIDQPEDNLDNRLIRQVIVNILASIKLQRQVIVATHNPNVPVLGDAEYAVVLQGVGDRRCKIEAAGDLDSRSLARHLTDVMEGGREAFQYRHTIYNEHWKGPVEDGE